LIGSPGDVVSLVFNILIGALDLPVKIGVARLIGLAARFGRLGNASESSEGRLTAHTERRPWLLECYRCTRKDMYSYAAGSEG
jgi:hypothetical protein